MILKGLGVFVIVVFSWPSAHVFAFIRLPHTTPREAWMGGWFVAVHTQARLMAVEHTCMAHGRGTHLHGSWPSPWRTLFRCAVKQSHGPLSSPFIPPSPPTTTPRPLPSSPAHANNRTIKSGAGGTCPGLQKHPGGDDVALGHRRHQGRGPLRRVPIETALGLMKRHPPKHPPK